MKLECFEIGNVLKSLAPKSRAMTYFQLFVELSKTPAALRLAVRKLPCLFNLEIWLVQSTSAVPHVHHAEPVRVSRFRDRKMLSIQGPFLISSFRCQPGQSLLPFLLIYRYERRDIWGTLSAGTF